MTRKQQIIEVLKSRYYLFDEDYPTANLFCEFEKMADEIIENENQWILSQIKSKQSEVCNGSGSS